jgi:hypothetical protein
MARSIRSASLYATITQVTRFGPAASSGALAE